MNTLLLVLVYITTCITCMDLALSIVCRKKTELKWFKLLIVLFSVNVGILFFINLNYISGIIYSENVFRVLNLINKSLVIASVSYLIVFFPYFTTWVIAHPWRKPYKTIFALLSIIYAVTNVLSLISPIAIYAYLTFVIVSSTFFFCIIVMFKNMKDIKDAKVKIMVKTLFIVSLSLTPAMILSLLFINLLDLFVVLVLLSFAIVLLVFLFLIVGQEERVAETKEFDKSCLDVYGITERETEIVMLIRQGKSNKEIAYELSISVNTVNNHVAKIFSKTNVSSRIDLLNLLGNTVW